jgi:hypothetical protein
VQLEAKRFIVLIGEQRAKRISDLKRQPRYPLIVNGAKICTYVADFSYVRDTALVIEDCKGVETAAVAATNGKQIVGGVQGPHGALSPWRSHLDGDLDQFGVKPGLERGNERLDFSWRTAHRWSASAPQIAASIS